MFLLIMKLILNSLSFLSLITKAEKMKYLVLIYRKGEIEKIDLLYFHCWSYY